MKTEFPKTTENIKPIVLKFKEKLKNLYGDNIQKIILFGSYAGGNIHEESDVDLLLVLKNTESPYHENKFMNELKTNFSLDNEIYFSVLTTTAYKFENMPNPLYSNIRNEGIEL